MQASLDDQLTDDLTEEQLRRRNALVGSDNDTGLAGEEPATTPAATDYSRLSGAYDTGKLNDPNKTDAKYTIGRTLSGFGAQAGFTPEVIAALNKLGYGNFSGSGDKLSMSGLTDAGRKAGLGDDFSGNDFIDSFHANNADTKWGYNPFVQQSGQTAVVGAPPLPAGIRTPSAGTSALANYASAPQAGSNGGGNLAGDMVLNGQPAGMPAGWEDVGYGNLVRNTSTGQMVDRNHPIFIAAQQAGGGGGGATGGDPNAPKTDLESMLTKLLSDEAARKTQNDAFNTKIHDSITSRVNEAGQPVDDNDPIIQQQMRAARGESDRNLAMEREVMAARGAHEGLPTGAFDASLQSGIENAGTALSGQHAGLLAARYKDKLGELQNMLTLGAGVMNADEQADLNAKITAIKARLDDLATKQSGAISNRDIDARLSIANTGFGIDQQRLNQDDAHFYDNLGLTIGDREAAYNAIIMREMQGG